MEGQLHQSHYIVFIPPYCLALGNGPHACFQFMNRVTFIVGWLGWAVGLGNGPYVLVNGPYRLGNGLHGLGNGPHFSGIMSQFGIMSHSGLSSIRYYMLHSGLCR